MDPSIFLMYSVQPALQPCVPRPSLFPGGLQKFPLSCLFPPPVLQSKSVNGSEGSAALVLRSIQLLDDEDQIARESVFRAERIPERIDRPAADPCPRLVSILPESHFTACCRRHAFFLYPPVSSGFMAAECVLFLIRNDYAHSVLTINGY